MSEAMHLEYRDSTAIAGIGKMEYTTGALTPSSEMILDSVRAAIADAGGFNGVQEPAKEQSAKRSIVNQVRTVLAPVWRKRPKMS